MRNGGVETNSYKSNGLLASHTDALGKKTTYGYDSASRLNAVTNALLQVTRYTYNERGLL